MTATTPTTTKLLASGLVQDNEGVAALHTRLTQLQSSAHGPFSLVIVFTTKQTLPALKIPNDLPAYAFLVDDNDNNNNNNNNLLSEVSSNNVHVLDPTNGLMELHGLSVALFTSCQQQSNPSIQLPHDYRGCDLLLSHPWPKHTKHSSIPSFLSIDESVTAFAHQMKPRYHFSSGQNYFFQQLPYRNLSSTPMESNDTTPAVVRALPCTRFIGLANVSEINTTNKNKWLHALSITPLKGMTEGEIREVPLDAIDSPLVPPPSIKRSSLNELNSSNDDNNNTNDNGKRPRFSEEPVKSRFDHLENNAMQNNGGGAFFFGQNGNGRVNNNNNNNNNNNATIPSNPAIKTLFVGGLSREMTEQLLRKHFSTAVHVHKPADKFFAFVEFGTREAAEAVFKQSQQAGGLQLLGRSVTVGWGKDRGTQSTTTTTTTGSLPTPIVNEIPVLLEPPSPLATSLFIGGLPPIFLQEELLALFQGAVCLRPVLGKSFCFVDMADHASAVQLVTNARQTPLVFHERTLLIGWAKPVLEKDNKKIVMLEPPSAQANTLFLGNLLVEATIQDIEQFLQEDIGKRSVQKPLGKDYAFVEFDTTFSASTCLQRLSNNDESVSNSAAAIVSLGKSISVGWAKGRTADVAIADNECWFCLGSATVKAHLVLSIGEHVYLAMPRGAIVPDHVLIVPIDCVPNRFMLSADAKQETALYEKSIRKYYEEKCDKMCVLFERTLRTRGRDHMQINLVPLTKQQCTTLLEVFIKHASQLKITFAEVRGVGEIDDIVLSQEGGPCQEYFYLQIPDPTSTKNPIRRFLYVPTTQNAHESNNTPILRFPMLFGLEVIAEAIGDPRRGNWKNCLLSEEQEVIEADLFKERFAPYDITPP